MTLIRSGAISCFKFGCNNHCFCGEELSDFFLVVVKEYRLQQEEARMDDFHLVQFDIRQPQQPRSIFPGKVQGDISGMSQASKTMKWELGSGGLIKHCIKNVACRTNVQHQIPRL